MNTILHRLGVAGFCGSSFSGLILICLFQLPLWASDGGVWDTHVSITHSAANKQYAGVRALAVRDQMVFVGGLFDGISGSPLRNLAQWDGVIWSSVGNAEPNGAVHHVAVSEALLVITGDFTEVGAIQAPGIAAWDGSQWRALPGIGRWGGVIALAVQGTNIYVSHGADSIPFGPYLLKLTSAGWNTVGGGLWGGWNPEFAVPIQAILPLADHLYIAGIFSTIQEITVNNLALWDGRQWSAIGGGVYGVIKAMTPTAQGLVIAGNFTQFGDGTAGNVRNVARWDGTNWFTFDGGPFITRCNAMTVEGEHVFVGGNRLARWDGRHWTNLGDVPLSIEALVWYRGSLLVGGSFDQIAGLPAANFALWQPAPQLTWETTAENVQVSWPTQFLNFTLQFSDTATGPWAIAPPAQTVGDRFVFTDCKDHPQRFFRLFHR